MRHDITQYWVCACTGRCLHERRSWSERGWQVGGFHYADVFVCNVVVFKLTSKLSVHCSYWASAYEYCTSMQSYLGTADAWWLFRYFYITFLLALLCPHPLRGGIKQWCCLTSVAYIGSKSITERPRKTKIGTEVAHVTRDSDTTFKSRKVTGGGGILWWPPEQLVFGAVTALVSNVTVAIKHASIKWNKRPLRFV